MPLPTEKDELVPFIYVNELKAIRDKSLKTFFLYGQPDSEKRQAFLEWLLKKNNTPLLDELSQKVSYPDNIAVILDLSIKTNNFYLLNKVLDNPDNRKSIIESVGQNKFEKIDSILRVASADEKFTPSEIVELLKLFIKNKKTVSVSYLLINYPEIINNPEVDFIFAHLDHVEKKDLASITVFISPASKSLVDFFSKHFSDEIKRENEKAVEPIEPVEQHEIPDEDPIPLSAELFAHIQNDAEASGTSLEGSSFSENVPYYLKTLKRMHTDGTLNFETYERIKDYFGPIFYYRRKIEKIIINKQSYKIESDKFKMELALDWLKKGKITFPGGYYGDPGGHAMIYEFSIENNHIIFKIFNTGEGIRNHSRYQAPDTDRYSPVLAYRFPISEGDFSKRHNLMMDLIEQAVSPLIIPAMEKKSTSAEIIYDGFLQLNKHYGGHEISVEGLSDLYIKPQRSGICSWKVMMVAQRLARPIKLQLKYDSLLDYLATILKLTPIQYQMLKAQSSALESMGFDSRTLTVGQIRQTEFALENIARLVNKCVKRDNFDVEKADSLKSQLKGIKSFLSTMKENRLKPESLERKEGAMREVIDAQMTEVLVQSLAVSRALEFPSLSDLASNLQREAVEATIALPVKWTDLPPIEGKNAFDFLENVNNCIMSLKDDPQVDPMKLSTLIEECIKKNMQEEQFKIALMGLEKKEQAQSLKVLFNMIHQYNQSLARQGNRLLFSHVLTRFQLIELAFLVSKQYFQEDIEIVNLLHDSENENKALFTEILNSPYLKTLTESEHKQIASFFKGDAKLAPNSSSESNIRLFYAVFKGHPQVVEALGKEAILRRACPPLAKQESTSKALVAYWGAKKNGEELPEIEDLVLLEEDLKVGLLLNNVLIERNPTGSGVMKSAENIRSDDFADNVRFHVGCWKNPNAAGEKTLHLLPASKTGTYGSSVDLEEGSTFQDPKLKLKFESPKTFVQENASAIENKFKQRGSLLRAIDQINGFSSLLRVPATLEFLKTHFDDLAEPDIQQIMLKELFYPPLFYEAILSIPGFLSDICNHVTFCVEKESKSVPLSAQGLFYLQIRSYLIKYCDSSIDKETREQGELLKALDPVLTHALGIQQEDNNAIQAITQALILSKGLSLLQDLNEETLLDYWETLLLQSQTPLSSHPISIFEQDMLNEIIFRVGDKLMSEIDKGEINSGKFIITIRKILTQHNLIHEEEPLILDLPFCQVGDVRINMQTMRVFHKGISQRFIPEKILTHSDFKAHFGPLKPFKAGVGDDDNYCNFRHPITGKKYEFKIKNAHESIIRMNQSIGGAEAWYTFLDLKKKDTLAEDIKLLPWSLLDSRLKHWVSDKPNNHMIIMEDDQPLYFADLDKNTFFLMQAGRKTDFQLVNMASLPDDFKRLLYHFENPHFIEVFNKQDAAVPDILIKLPRYNLSFQLQEGKWICLEYPRFQLDLNPLETSLAPLGAGLRLKSANNAQGQEIFIVPDQRFIKYDGVSSNEYRPIIYEQGLARHEAEVRTLSELIENMKVPTLKDNPAAHVFRGQEKHFVFSVKENEVFPNTFLEKIQLTYLYMGLREHEKAFEWLLQASQGLEGEKPTLAHVESLRRIIVEVPSSLGEEEIEMETSQGAQATALRLLALNMIISIKSRYPDLFTKSPLELPSEDVAQAISLHHQNVTQKYCQAKNIHLKFIRIYSRYLSLKRNVPVNMRPSLKMERFMLDQAKEQGGFLGKSNIIYRDRQFILTEKLKFKRDIESQTILTSDDQKLLAVLAAEIKSLETMEVTQERLIVWEDEVAERETIQKKYPVKPIYSYQGKQRLHLSSVPTSVIPEILDERFRETFSGITGESILELSGFLESSAEQAPHIARQIEEIKEDLLVGSQSIRKFRAQEQYSEQYFSSNSEELARIKQELTEKRENLNKDTFALEDEILDLMNLAPGENEAQVKWALSLLGRTKEKLSFNVAIDLFLQNDISYYQQKTNLTLEGCQALHQKIYEYLIHSTQQQKINRALEALDKKNYQKLGEILIEERHFDPLDNPDLLLFEYLDNKQLRKKQAEYLSNLSGEGAAPYQVIQLIMGGGKSKILTPLLAQRFADGVHLAMQVVPQALFNTSYEDATATFRTLFNKTVRKFEFSREDNASVKALEKIEKYFLQAIVDREPIMTTPESLQSLELKYLELMKISADEDPAAERKVEILSRLLIILKTRTVPLVDEVDKVLAPKRVLNYTIGAGKMIPAHLREANIALYTFLEKNNPGVLSKKTDSPSQTGWEMIINDLGIQLVDYPDSPLRDIVLALSLEEKDQLKSYLLEKIEEVPEFITALSEKNQDRLALYKAQLCQFLPETLLAKCNMDYGPQAVNDDVGLAIPYDKGTPNFESSFSNYITAMNYTIQLQANRPLTEAMLLNALKDFTTRITWEDKLGTKSARREFKQHFGISWNEVGDIYKIEREGNKQALNKLFNSMRASEQAKNYCLRKYTLPNIRYNPMMLSSNAQSFVSMFSHRFIAFSGTDYNYRCYHPNIVCQKAVSKGTDGQTIYHLLRKNIESTVFEHVEEDSLEKSMASLLRPDVSLPACATQAFIDLGGIGADLQNFQFAQILAMQESLAARAIKYILFFDNNELCALPVSDHTALLDIIRIGSSDKKHVHRILSAHAKEKITPDEYFTYYDTPHTVGTDIVQSEEAHAILSIDKQTSLRDLLQAVMRMRQLSENQTIDYFVPKVVRDFYPNIKVWSVEAIIQLAVMNQVLRLSDDILASAFQKMDDTLRNKALTISLSLPYAEKKIWLDKFEQVLYQVDEARCFFQYGGIDSICAVQDLLQEKKNSLLSIIREQCPELEQEVMADLNNIIKSTIDFVPEKIKSSIEKISQQSAVSQMQKQNQKQQEKQGQRQNQRENEGKNVLQGVMVEKLFSPQAIIDRLQSTVDLSREKDIHTLDNYLSSQAPDFKFDSDVYVSGNFSKIYQSQNTLFDDYARNAMFILNVYNQTSNSVKMLLVTTQEAAAIKEHPLGARVWLETATGSVVAGKRLLEDETFKYLNQKQQINYLTGNLKQAYDLHKTLREKGALSWLSEKTLEKLDFYNNSLAAVHSDKPNLIKGLKKELAQEPLIAVSVQETPFVVSEPENQAANANEVPAEDNSDERQSCLEMLQGFFEEYKDLLLPQYESLEDASEEIPTQLPRVSVLYSTSSKTAKEALEEKIRNLFMQATEGSKENLEERAEQLIDLIKKQKEMVEVRGENEIERLYRFFSDDVSSVLQELHTLKEESSKAKPLSK